MEADLSGGGAAGLGADRKETEDVVVEGVFRAEEGGAAGDFCVHLELEDVGGELDGPGDSWTQRAAGR